MNRILLFAFACVIGLLMPGCPASEEDAAETPLSEPAHPNGADDEASTQQPETQQPESMPSSGHGAADEGTTGVGNASEDQSGPVVHDMEQMEHVLDEADVDPASVVGQPGASVGDITRCPVSGELFEVSDESTYFDHEGQRVYFCCPSCIRRFQRDPERYLAASGENEQPGHEHADQMIQVSLEGARIEPPAQKSQIPSGSWICDMGTVHYARGEEGDGECPLCGMRLVEWSGEN